MQRIGRILDRAVHLTVANWFALCLPFVFYEGGSTLVAALTSDDWTGYFEWLAAASVLEIWSRTAAICVLRGERFSHAIVAALRRPVLVVYVIAACAEPWLTDLDTAPIWLPVFVAGSLIVFATMLALAGTVADDVKPVRALAFWLRDMCRPRRLGVNLAGALVIACLTIIVPYVLAAVPGADWEPLRYVFVLAYALGDAFAMAFVVLWRDAVLDERYGRDIEHVLDARPA